MAGINGRDVKVAYKIATTWGTAASVTKQINLRTLEGFDAKPGVVTDESFNQSFIGQGEIGDYAPTSPELLLDLRYDGAAPVLLAMACGSASAPVVVSSVAASSLVAYSHDIHLTADLTKFLTLAAAMGDPVPHFVLEVPSLKPRGFSLSVGDNGKMQISVPCVGNKTVYISSINVNSTIGGATAESLSNRVFRKQGILQMNLTSGNTLAAGDAINIREFNLTYARPLADGDQVFGQDYIIEADDDGWAEFTGDMVFPRMTSANANSLVIAFPAAQHLKAQFKFTGAYINSLSTYALWFSMPAMQITEWAAPVTGHNLVRPTAKVAFRKSTAVPMGFGTTTAPMQIFVVNMNSANLLT